MDTLHRASGRRGRGLALAAATMLLWGLLPLGLELALRGLDAPTITFVRFLVAALALGGWLAARGRLPALRRLSGSGRALLAAATLFLAVNYLSYLVALDWTSAASAQVLIQLAPLLLALGGILVFRERFTRTQWIGFAVMVTGLLVFFAEQVGALVVDLERYVAGSAVMVLAAATWAVYGLAQKQLLRSLSSQQIMWVIYAGCALLFAPIAEPGRVLALPPLEACALAFCAANTLLAYGAFSEALAHWEASRVSAVLALTPLATLGFVALGSRLAPGIVPPEPLAVGSWLGAALVVAGSLTTSLGAGRSPAPAEPVTAPGVPVETSAPLGQPAPGPTAKEGP